MINRILLLLLVFPLAIIPAFGFCGTEYDHQKDIVYGYKDGMALVMDVYSPKGGNNKAGVIVIMAGGMTSKPAWSHNVGNRTDVQTLLAEGYVVFAAAHSSQPKYTTDESRWDIPRAVRFIRHNAIRLGIDPDRIGIMGYSSGGHDCLMVATSPPPENPDSDDPVEQESSKVQVAVAYYPSTDLLNFGQNNVSILDHFNSLGYSQNAAFDFHRWDDKSKRFERIIDPESQIEYYRRNSPITFVSEDDPPILLIHGDKDKLVPIQQSELITDKLDAMNVPNKLLVMEGEGHGWKDPQKDELKEVVEWFRKYLNPE